MTNPIAQLCEGQELVVDYNVKEMAYMRKRLEIEHLSLEHWMVSCKDGTRSTSPAIILVAY